MANGISRRKLTLEELIRQGRRLLDERKPVEAHHLFLAWDRNVAEWLDESFPGSGFSADWTSQPMSTLVSGAGYSNDPLSWSFFRTAVQSRMRWLARFAKAPSEKEAAEALSSRPALPSTRVFLVHGRPDGPRDTVARFLEKLHLEVVILHEQPNRGRTLIQKFTDYADVAFAVVILTGDDMGGLVGEEQKPRPRQNVIFELGFFLGKLGLPAVCALYEEGVEIPSDYDGVTFVPLNGEWRLPLARELQVAGLPVDMNDAVGK